MYALFRQCLFALEAERSHDLTLAAFAALSRLPGSARPAPGRPRRLFGIEFPNAVGLAAGLDKDARAVLGFARMGFGHIEVGTLTPRPQPGNPKPRLFRLPAHRAIINRMGFNSGGVAAATLRLDQLRQSGRLDGVVLGVNVGKNKDTPLEAAADDYVKCMAAVYGSADYLTLNLSSPNTPGLRTLQSQAALVPLLERVADAGAGLAQRHGRRVPVLLKIAPDLVAEDLDIIAAAARDCGIDGIIATNTTITRPGIAGDRHGGEAGGLSGAPLTPLALSTLVALRARVGRDFPLIGVGGIDSEADGRARLDAGADLLQIYTGFVYHGPRLVRALARL
ncbi:MAG: quinone-dependent dihydroorotate dehydrogenase [Gammaproteobacteria bacterium]